LAEGFAAAGDERDLLRRGQPCGERGSVVYRVIAVADDGRAVGQEIVNEAPATRCPEVGALAAHDKLVEPAAADGGSGQRAGGTPTERRAVG
jgi:hypothetical protein